MEECHVYQKAMPKSSIELEIERIQAEKKALIRYKRKQQRLYERIRSEYKERAKRYKLMGGVAAESLILSKEASKGIVNSYVQSAL
jgi:thymidylate kinase